MPKSSGQALGNWSVRSETIRKLS